MSGSRWVITLSWLSGSWRSFLSMFIFTFSCLTISNLLWFIDLIFQVPMQYYSIQHWTILLSSVTSTTGCFCFGSISSFFLESFLHWSPVAYWAPPYLGSSSFNILSFCLSILFMGFSRQEYWSSLPFPSPVDHVLSELCWLKKMYNLRVVSQVLFGGKMRTAAQEAASQIALRDCSKVAVGESQYIRFWWRGSSILWSTQFTKGFLLVMRVWCHHEGVLMLL